MIIGVINTKGGSAKTTTSTNLAVTMAHRGYKVCLLDTDAGQESSKIWLENRPEDLPNIHIEAVAPKFLASTAKALEREGNLVIIDSAPKQSELANLIIVASDILIIPVQPTYYDFRGFENFLENFRMFRNAKEANGGKVGARVLLTRTKPNTIMLESIKQALLGYEVPLFETEIVEREAYKATASMGLGVTEYSDPKAKAEMEALSNEIEALIQNF
jgi:chromosome partitioning protein